jgi:hypothetical protein
MVAKPRNYGELLETTWRFPAIVLPNVVSAPPVAVVVILGRVIVEDDPRLYVWIPVHDLNVHNVSLGHN